MQAEPGPQTPTGPRGELSLWALASLLCSVSMICPPAAVLGPLLGVRALVEIKSNPNRRGRRLALAGIVIGVLATGGWGVAAWWWNVNARRPMVEGPKVELEAGFRGDLTALKRGFHGDGATAADAEAAAFIAALRERYGRFLGTAQNRGDAAGGSPIDRSRPRIPYLLQFETGPVEAEAEFIITAAGARRLVLKFGWIVVRDDERGDLVYPKSAEAVVDEAPAAEEGDNAG